MKQRSKIIGMAAAALAIAAGLVLLLRPDAGYPSNDPRSIAVQNEKRYAAVNRQALEEKDYVSYQESILGYVRSFLSVKDYNGAQHRLDEILKSVPKRELSVHTYMALTNVAKGRGDQEAYRKYSDALVTKLDGEGRKAEAEQYRQEAAKAR